MKRTISRTVTCSKYTNADGVSKLIPVTTEKSNPETVRLAYEEGYTFTGQTNVKYTMDEASFFAMASMTELGDKLTETRRKSE